MVVTCDLELRVGELGLNGSLECGANELYNCILRSSARVVTTIGGVGPFAWWFVDVRNGIIMHIIEDGVHEVLNMDVIGSSNVRSHTVLP